MVNVQNGLLEFIRDGGNHHPGAFLWIELISSGAGPDVGDFQVAGAVWGALISLCLAPWRMVRIHVLGSSPDASSAVFNLTVLLVLGHSLPLVLMFVVTHGKHKSWGAFPAAVLGLFPALQTGLTPTIMARFCIVGGGLEVFEPSDLK